MNSNFRWIKYDDVEMSSFSDHYAIKPKNELTDNVELFSRTAIRRGVCATRVARSHAIELHWVMR
jgi:hypothetical protein